MEKVRSVRLIEMSGKKWEKCEKWDVWETFIYVTKSKRSVRKKDVLEKNERSYWGLSYVTCSKNVSCAKKCEK